MAYHGTKRDQPNESIWRQQTQTNDQRISQGLQIVVIQTGIDNKKEDGRDGGWASEGVFDGSVFGQELSGEVCV